MKRTIIISGFIILLMASLTLGLDFISTEEETGKDYYYIYDYKPIIKPVYDIQNITIADSKKLPNGTTVKPIIKTNIVKIGEQIIGYEPIKLLGVSVNGKVYSGFAYYKKGYVSKFKYSQGNRNVKEFGRCRAYEIKKGVCKEVKV